MTPELRTNWIGQLPTEPLRIAANGLIEGLNNREDTITWRTLAVQLRFILGSPEPERVKPNAPVEQAEALVREVTKGTYMENLEPEILYALGYMDREVKEDYLDTLIINARYGPETLVWKLADTLAAYDKKIAVINTVGRHADQANRIVGPKVLFHRVHNAVFLVSTQRMYGGSTSTLSQTLRLLMNENFGPQIENVSVIIPMFEGSRSHKPGQADEIGYEVLEAEAVPEDLSDLIKRVDNRLGERAPKVMFGSVDIHNLEMPTNAFAENGYEFKSIGPERSFAYAVEREINEQTRPLDGFPIRLVAVDQSASDRTKALGVELLLRGGNGHNYVDVIVIRKIRNSAGAVSDVSIESIVRMTLESGELKYENIDADAAYCSQEFIRLTSDDMLDSGRSAKKDDELLDRRMANAVFKISVFTHPVMSEGVRSALDNTGADVVIISNTLTRNEPIRDSRVRLVDVSRDIAASVWGDLNN